MKLKRIVVFMLSVGAFITLAASKKEGYTIDGKVKGGKDGDTVLLVESDGWGIIPHDTAIVKNGKFVFKGQQDEPVFRFVMCKRAGEFIGSTYFILENAKIKIEIDPDQRKAVTGSVSNLLWNEYVEDREKKSADFNMYWDLANDSSKNDTERRTAEETLTQLRIKRMNDDIDFIQKNIKTGVAHLILEGMYSSIPISKLEEISLNMERNNLNSKFAQVIKQYVHAQKMTEVGNTYKDLSLSDQSGVAVRLSDVVSQQKLTLIDFWASWCIPCLQEVPHLIATYKKYKSKGFEIIGISLDNNEGAWKKSIHQHEMNWIHVSDLKGWQSDAAKEYGVRSIPFTLLVDQNGKIVGENLRGAELEEKVRESLGQ